MGSFPGQPASAAIAKLGFPTEERIVAGQKVYIWATNNLVEAQITGAKFERY